jgi:uncharacterized protein (DUF1800 family)
MISLRYSPVDAWKPLDEPSRDSAAARHLCSRLGFSIRPEWLDSFKDGGPPELLQAALGKIHPMPRPESVLGMVDEMDDYRTELRQADEAEKREIRQELRKQNRASYTELAVDWCNFARDPGNSAQEKLVLFFQNVWVVAFAGVRSTPALLDYQERVRHQMSKTYPEMCRSLAVSPAMVRYLNLNQNNKGSPNENFARELFELFTLGEGNYSEDDIKEAARALTGYTVDAADEVKFVKKRHDTSQKTIFGQSGNFGLEDVIELVFQQPAAARFLPQELAKFYLTENGLSEEVLQPLADQWRESGFSLPFLIKTFFSSRIFFDEQFRGNLIKSPIQFSIGLLQDLDLDVFPSPRLTTNSLRTMGQAFFNPPNVRGWVGGRSWINSATLIARNQFVQSCLNPIPAGRLNADEKAAIEKAEAEGRARYSVDPEWLIELGRMSPQEAAEFLSARLHTVPRPDELVRLFADETAQWPRQIGTARLKTALTSPAYHLC